MKTIEVWDCEEKTIVETYEVSDDEFREEYEWCLSEPEKYAYGPDGAKWTEYRLKKEDK